MQDPLIQLEFIQDRADEYAQAKAEFGYLTEYRKSLKSRLMIESHERTAALKEAYAYAHFDYQMHLDGIKEAEQKYEALRYKLKAAEIAIEIWRSKESSNRAINRNV